ncbi:unnamed protein product [Meganyctiphanes norvegica]|uniref:Echinoderm microtubule-associated protein-like 1 n=1 Tax=Meganyctiphanes norvegica TaxID=48144 RepID=A0AAV2QAD6_MEGNR
MPNVAKNGFPDVQYDPDKGTVKQFLRGRPLVYFVPEELKDKKYNPKGKSRMPKAWLTPEWVYGYRGKDCRNNMIYLEPSGELAYFVAAVVVLYHVEENTQRCYMEHTDGVKSLAVHPDNITIATGQSVGTNDDAKAHIRIWNSQTLETLRIIGYGEFQRQISCLAFSQIDDGQFLAVIENSDPHRTLSLWNWNTQSEQQTKIATTRCPEEVLNVSFSKKDSNIFITTGKQHINFFTLQDGVIKKRMGIFGNRGRPKYVYCCACFDNGQFITGDYYGNLILWKQGGNTVERQFQDAHKGPIFTMFVKEDIVLTGGKDGIIKRWNNRLELIHEVKIPSEYGKPRSIAWNGSQIFIGTNQNNIYRSGINETWAEVTQGQTEELWTLASHPIAPVFLAGDKTTYLIDAKAHSTKWKMNLEEKVQSATFSPTGELIVIGTESGKWKSIQTDTKEIIADDKSGDKPLQVVRFSPCGNYLAIGSKDNLIYIYEVSKSNKFTKMGKCEGHSSSINHLDWSADSQYIQSNSGDYELLFWQAQQCKQILTPSEVSEVKWSTHTCVLSLYTLGIWPRGVDGTDINSCARSGNHNYIATGDDFGKVKLFKYPAHIQIAEHKVYGGHCSHVTNVTFLHNDTHLISTGGKDTAVIQWAVESSSSTTTHN